MIAEPMKVYTHQCARSIYFGRNRLPDEVRALHISDHAYASLVICGNMASVLSSDEQPVLRGDQITISHGDSSITRIWKDESPEKFKGLSQVMDSIEHSGGAAR